jgi:hypothetical protein|tara:strand:- start:660 stop:800 length:141 start_codon:yes stop_codon:yes gene_type:complete
MTWLVKIEVDKFEEAQKIVYIIEGKHKRNMIAGNLEIEYEELEDDL